MLTESKITNLQQWFAVHGENYLCCCSKTPSSFGSESYGYLRIEEFTERPANKGGYEEIKNFSYDPLSGTCSFKIDCTEFCLCLAYEPQDRWGNSADEKGVYLVSGCYEIFCTDTAYCEISDDLISSLPDWFEESERNLQEQFSLWLQSNYGDYQFIDTVTVERIAAGTDCSTTWGTTNKSFNSPEWLDLFEDFRGYWSATA